jgi:hypothetical protein
MEGNEVVTEKMNAKACIKTDCNGCEINGKLLCNHTHADLLDFGVLFIGWLIPFLAGMIIGRFWIGLIVWIGLAVVFFGYLEALILCRHCPHYTEDGFTLKCHANWGLPKIPKINPKPANKVERIVWLIYVLVLFIYPIPFFIAGKMWLLLAIIIWATFMWAWTVMRTQCNRCYNLSCIANRVPDDVKKIFFQNYPDYAKGWGVDDKN